MRTTVSIPDDLFRRADKLAQRLGKSRSQIYGEALAEYLSRRDARAVTDAINEVVIGAGPSLGSMRLAPRTG